MAGLYGINAYQQTNKTWSQETKKADNVSKKDGASKTGSTSDTKAGSDIKKTTWSPIDTSSSLVPSKKDGIGMAIGDVQLSDKAKDYYNQLKSKFGNMEFIAVSKDMKSQVQANAAAYGNANKQVVLIDDEKLEMMANDESFRKKYEGIIAMSQSQLASAKNSLASSGASVKNFGMSVNSDGSTNFFATLEKSSDDQTKRIEKKQAEKKAAKAKEKKVEEKKAKEKRLEKAKEEKKAKEAKLEDSDDESVIKGDKEYVKFEANSMEDLLNKVSKYAYDNSAKNVMTEEEKAVGQLFDFKG